MEEVNEFELLEYDFDGDHGLKYLGMFNDSDMEDNFLASTLDHFNLFSIAFLNEKSYFQYFFRVSSWSKQSYCSSRPLKMLVNNSPMTSTTSW